MQTTSRSESDTAALARQLAPSLKPGDILCLHGDLGMGKSVFARALIRALCRDDTMDVPSPTFTLVQIYDTDRAPVWHFDLYRLKEPEEVFELGWDEAQDGSITIVEWPERLGPYTPGNRIDVQIKVGENDARLISIAIHYPPS